MHTNYKLALAALAGFLLGAWLSYPRTVRAQYDKIQVQQVRVGSNINPMGGSDVVGSHAFKFKEKRNAT
jgi:hypothetical protein